MSGPQPKYPIELTTEEETKLETLINARNSRQGEVMRAKIVLTAHRQPDWNNQQIAQEVGCSDRTVRKWRKRWVERHSLADLPRPGAPRRFSAEVRAQATALACVRPQTQEGVPLARWSYAEIAARLVTLGLVVSIATSSVARWLSAEKLKPWRYRLWQQIEEPKAFLDRARPVLWLYQHAKILLKRGVWVVCVDEKTSIQARKRPQDPRPLAQGGQSLLLSSRYKREGALHLFAGLSVVDGQVYGLCQSRKRFVDFQHFLLTVIIPEALRRQVNTLALILDNGTTHAPKQLEAWLQQQIADHQWPLSIQIYWLPKNASWLDQIEIWFSILQRKLLTPNHFESLEALQTAIELFIAFYNRSAKPINWSYTVEKLEHKLGIN